MNYRSPNYILRRITLELLSLIYKHIFPKFFFFNKDQIIFIPDIGSAYNQDSIINFSSDNTLVLLRYIIDRQKLGSKKIIIVNSVKLHSSKIDKFLAPYNNIKSIINPFVESNYFRYLASLNSYLLFFSSSKTIINSNALQKFPYKNKKQINFCLNYYTPFKYDKPVKNSGKCEYVFSTSKLSSEMVSKTTKISLRNFYELGFPRHDSLFKKRITKDIILEKTFPNKTNTSKLIIYTPTHRDYHRGKKNIFGSDCSGDKIDYLLNKHNTLMIVKLHCNDIKVGTKEKYNNIVVHEPNEQYSLYDLLSCSEMLITDYTSTYFDYLQLNRPVIFYFYDFNEYKNNRGFMYENILDYCAGPISYNFEELYKCLYRYLEHGKDNFYKKRKEVNKIFNQHKKNNTKRILDFIDSRI